MSNCFLSVVSRPEEDDRDGTIRITFTSNNVDPEVSFYVDVVLAGTEKDEKAVARKIYLAILAKLKEDDNALLYGGAPVGNRSAIPFTFYPILTDHVVCIWSQGDFSVEISSEDDPIPATVLEGSVPAYATVTEFLARYRALGVSLEPITGGDALEEDEIASAIEFASGEAYSVMGRLICKAVYWHQQSMSGEDGFTVDQTPCVLVHRARSKGPAAAEIGIIQDNAGISDFIPDNVGRETGVISFATMGISPMDTFTAGDFGNYLSVTYVAGERSIPAVLRREVIKLVGAQIIPTFISKLKIGTAEIQFKDIDKVRKEFNTVLAGLAI